MPFRAVGIVLGAEDGSRPAGARGAEEFEHAQLVEKRKYGNNFSSAAPWRAGHRPGRAHRPEQASKPLPPASLVEVSLRNKRSRCSGHIGYTLGLSEGNAARGV